MSIKTKESAFLPVGVANLLRYDVDPPWISLYMCVSFLDGQSLPTTLVYYLVFKASAAGLKYLRRLGPVGRRYPNFQLYGAFAPYTIIG